MGNTVSTQSQINFGLACLGGFVGAHKLAGAVLQRVLPAYQQGKPLERHQWENYSVAGLYTALVAALGWRETFGSTAGATFPPPPSSVAGVSDTCRWLTLSMAAYLAYDFGCILRSLRLAQEQGGGEASQSGVAGKFFHHALGFFGILSCLFVNMGGKVNMWVYFGEASTPFLSLRWMLLTAGLKGSALCKACEVLFAASFTYSRILSVPGCVKYIWGAREVWQPTWHWAYILATTCAFLGQNIFWFVHIVNMVKKALGLGGKKKQKQPEEDAARKKNKNKSE